MADTPDDWGVFVDECGIFATANHAAEWWVAQSLHIRADLLTMLAMSPCGGHFHFLTETRENAEFVHEYILSKGIHKNHVKVQRLSAAKAKAAKRTAAFEERCAR